MIDRLLKVGMQVVGERRHGGALSGQRVVFTGSLSSLTRAEAAKQVESLGGRVASSVGPGVAFVVVGASLGEKLDAARKYGVREMSEREFLMLLSAARAAAS